MTYDGYVSKNCADDRRTICDICGGSFTITNGAHHRSTKKHYNALMKINYTKMEEDNNKLKYELEKIKNGQFL